MMSFRLGELRAAREGLRRTGRPLVSWHQGQVQGEGHLVPAGFSDDIGAYYFVPKLAETLSVSTMAATSLFLYGAVALGYVLGILGAMLYLRSLLGRVVGIVALTLLALVTTHVGDLYVFYFVGPAALALIFLQAVDGLVRRRIIVTTAAVGVVVGISHTIRSHSATALAVFALIYLATEARLERRLRLAAALVLVLSLAAPLAYMAHIVNERDEFLESQNESYEPGAAVHPFWHSVYIGLGFVPNEYGITYLDEVAFDFVEERAPEAPRLSKQYDEVLQDELWRIVTSDPLFILQVIGVKLMHLLGYLLLFCNVGLVAAVYRPKTWRLEVAFWTAIVLSFSPGLLVAPYLSYVVGLASFATLYAIVSIDHALVVGRKGGANRGAAPR